MCSFLSNSIVWRILFTSVILLSLCATFSCTAHAAKKKKKAEAATPAVTGPRKYNFDPTKLVWPSPPNIARVKWVNYFAGAKIDYTETAKAKPKSSWMDRLAGWQSEDVLFF